MGFDTSSVICLLCGISWWQFKCYSFIFSIRILYWKKYLVLLVFWSLQVILLYLLSMRVMNTYPIMLNVLLCWMYGNSVCLESCVAAKLASKKAALLLPQFWLSVGLIREEQGYRRLDWSWRKCLLKIQSSFPSFSLCDNIWSNSELLLLMIGTAFLSWGNLCLCPTNLVATVAQAFMGISNSLGLLWQHLTCVPCCRMCNTALKDKLKWQLLVTLPASLESLTGCQLEPVLFMCNKIPV